MLSQVYYLLRSKLDGSYLVAHPDQNKRSHQGEKPQAGYLLMFREHFDALSYLNTHAAEFAERFAVESISGTQLESLIKRWDFVGVGIVQDPLLPRVEFMSR